MARQYHRIADNFNAGDYRRLNTDLQKYDDFECKVHYILYGKALGLKHSIAEEIPADFDIAGYRKYNPDIAEQSEEWLRFHYVFWGKNENRVYRIDLTGLPDDFCFEGYRRYNPDLAKASDAFLANHFKTHGVKEQRTYKVDLPDDFDSVEYAFFNKDLTGYTPEQLEAHYSQHGKSENRKYKDTLFDSSFFISYNKIADYQGYATYTQDITKIKSKAILDKIEQLPKIYANNCIFLVGHNCTLQGATHMLYSLYNQLKETSSKKVYILDDSHNQAVLNKYNIASEDFICYERDSTLLYHICKKLNPSKILLNSINSQFVDLCRVYDTSKIMIYSHEVKQAYDNFNYPVDPNYVVSTRISKQYNSAPHIQPPILTQDVLRVMEEEFAKPVAFPINRIRSLDCAKPVIGMCGGTNTRKGYQLFIDIAKAHPQYEFFWIGGHVDFDELQIDNLFQVKQEPLPFKYYKLLDWFFLTSDIDPCPYVVLESLYAGMNVLTFKENIYTDHKCAELEGIYCEYPGSINFDTAKEALSLYIASNKKPTKNTQGKKYVLSRFSKITEHFLNSAKYEFTK